MNNFISSLDGPPHPKDCTCQDCEFGRTWNLDPAEWAEPPALSATVVGRTRGFGSPDAFLICGERGGLSTTGWASPCAETTAKAHPRHHAVERVGLNSGR